MSDNGNEQSFNEDELKDIMDEIESLEEDYGEVEGGAAPVEAAAESVENEVSEGDDTASEEVLDASAESDTVADEPVIDEPTIVAVDDEDDLDDDVDEVLAAEEAVSEVEAELDDMDAMGDEPLEDSFEDEVVEEVFEEPVAEPNNVVELTKEVEVEKVVPVSRPASVGGAGVNMNASGQMDLALDFSFNGAASKIVLEQGSVKINLPGVHVVFDEETGCQITADNGMTFQLPLAVKKAS